MTKQTMTLIMFNRVDIHMNHFMQQDAIDKIITRIIKGSNPYGTVCLSLFVRIDRKHPI